MNIIEESYKRLFPEKKIPYITAMEYNRRLSDFNANIALRGNVLRIHLNLQWKDIDNEITIGLIQHLLCKLLKAKVHTHNIDLYNNFVKNIPLLTLKTKTHPVLEESFIRVNSQFFNNDIEQPNLQWGTNSKRKLASYNFHNDTITVSTLFKDVSQHILDYLMYHEMLHKHHTFRHKNGRSAYHTKEFKDDEKQYPGWKNVENEINTIIRKNKGRNLKHFFQNRFLQ
ncbi:hypothetical protein COV17_04160 [Candidatus Woesearchaeota archaeon CG10_big_fil_rev_8_21_14_0_10_36_11]|nr:MAG: hypothetical protein COV17_04160 [Candidatus Woesearchaeota archaeon CG10_big_fil_rev_8_21_14_0_10_36_11]